GRAIALPETLARPRMGGAQRVQQLRLRRDPVDHPERRRIRGDRAEQRFLLTDRPEIRHALPAIGEHHRQITEHPARVMATAALLEAGQPKRQRPREPQLVGHRREQRAPRVRDQTVSVRGDFYGYRASITHHLQGEPPSSNLRPSSSRRIAAQPDVSTFPRPRSAGGAVSYCTPWVSSSFDASADAGNTSAAPTTRA